MAHKPYIVYSLAVYGKRLLPLTVRGKEGPAGEPRTGSERDPVCLSSRPNVVRG